MKTKRKVICNDDFTTALSTCVPGQAQQSLREWVDFFLLEGNIDTFAVHVANPDITYHESTVGERLFSRTESFPSAGMFHRKEILDELKAQGTDALDVMATQVHHHNREVIASIRMSDIHYCIPGREVLTPRFVSMHPEWRIKREDGSFDPALDYSFTEVREHRFAIFREIVQRYDVDGLELDFMRWCRHFPPHLAEERIPVMTEYVGKIREMLDRFANEKSKERLVLGMRVPPTLRECRHIGLDPEMWVRNDWVDYLCPADFDLMNYEIRTEEYAQFCKGTRCGVYPCLIPLPTDPIRKPLSDLHEPKPVDFSKGLRFTEEHFRGAIRNFYAWGADGISTFNFCCTMEGTSQYPNLVHQVAAESKETVFSQPASYFHLPLWRGTSPFPGADQTGRVLCFGRKQLNQRQIYRFRTADGRNGERVSGRMRFRIYNLEDNDELRIDLNNRDISGAILERRRMGGGVADQRYPALGFPPHIAYEIDLTKCPAWQGDNELGLVLVKRNELIESDCMLEAIEICVGWEGQPQKTGYVIS